MTTVSSRPPRAGCGVAVRAGDKRVLLLDGGPLDAVVRRPAGADLRANICVGGEVEAADLDADDRRIIEAMAPALRADGLAFVGIDVVDGHLTEVNVTSPTGLRHVCALSGERPDLEVVRWLEGRVHASPRRASPRRENRPGEFVHPRCVHRSPYTSPRGAQGPPRAAGAGGRWLT
jgi:hypothetical protein